MAIKRIRQFVRRRPFLAVTGCLLALFCARLGFNVIMTLFNLQRPVDCYLVLGGDVIREMLAASLARSHPQVYIIISGGSAPHCIYKTFQICHGPLSKVFVEGEAQSTFENFLYSTEIMKRLDVRHAAVITSPGNNPRAELLAHIFLSAHGIASGMYDTPAIINPKGHDESELKTELDATRTFLWALLTQIYLPPSQKLSRMTAKTPDQWEQEWQEGKFDCQPLPGKMEQLLDVN